MISDRLESVILSCLLYNEVYCKKVLYHIEPDVFDEQVEKLIFASIKNFIITYNSVPSLEAILIQIQNNKKVSDDLYNQIKEYVEKHINPKEVDLKWLVDSTLDWLKMSSFRHALIEGAQIVTNPNSKKDLGELKKTFEEIINKSFDESIGHSYTEDFLERYDHIHKKEEKFEFDLDYLNKITNGGVEKKTLNVLMAGTGVGKTLALCHFAGMYLMQGKNILYITLEMSAEKIAMRIDANLSSTPLNDILEMPKDVYERKMCNIINKTHGRLIIKEYPMASAHRGHFEHLLNELQRHEKSFVPDVIMIDYLNIAASSRIKPGANANSYTYVKSIAEELRGLAQDRQVPIWTATQVNRQGFASSDINMENVSESFGLPMTADFLVALNSPENLEQLGQMQVKQLKNRYGDVSQNRRFIIGVDKSKMKLYDVDPSAQQLLEEAGIKTDDKPAFDRTGFGKGMFAERENKFANMKFTEDEDNTF